MDAIVTRFGGDEELVAQLVALFVAECPRMFGDVRAGVSGGCADDIRRAAHTFKGSVGNFTTGAVYEEALALEQIGQSGDIAAAPETLARLERELDALLAVMRHFQEHRCTS